MGGVVDSRPTLLVKGKEKGRPSVYQLDQKEVTIGRDDGNFVVLPSRSVSRRHATISSDGDLFFLLDLKSSNGTTLNERKMSPGEKSLLRPGDRIRIENFELFFELKNRAGIPDPYDITDTDILEVKMIKKMLRAIDKETSPSFEILQGSMAANKFSLEGKTQVVTAGRDPSCEWMIDEEMISRRHVRITKKWDTVIVEDLKSKNGTFVNNKKIKERTLRDGDLLLLGTLPIRFRNPQDLDVDALAPILKKEEETPEATPPETAEVPPVDEPSASPLFPSEPIQEEAWPAVTTHRSLAPVEILWLAMGGLIFLLCATGIYLLLR